MDCKESIGRSSMKLRTKIKFAAVAVAFASTVGSTFFGYWATKYIFITGLKENAKSLASVVAASVDPQILESIRIQADEKTSQYAKLETLIQELTAANQNGDFPIRFVYLLIPTNTGSSSGWDFAFGYLDSRGHPAPSAQEWKPSNDLLDCVFVSLPL